MLDQLERKRRTWHGQQVKKGIRKAKVQKLAAKKAAERLRKTTRAAVVKRFFQKVA
jgi:hypothetical protein